jgi:hypothetical protein
VQPAALVWLKSISNEVFFTHEAGTIFSPYPPSHCIEVSEISHVVLPAHVLLFVRIRLKSVTKEGLFTLETEIVFRPYIPSHCIEVNELCYMALPSHSLPAV